MFVGLTEDQKSTLQEILSNINKKYKNNYQDDYFNCRGEDYVKSGRYVDDPKNCFDMIKNKESIKIIE